MAWTKIAPVTDLPEGRGVRVELPGARVALFRIGGDVYAVGDRCSHAEASLAEGTVWDDAVECPRHGAEFDLASGKALSLPATTPVPTYETKVDDGILYLDVPEDAP